MEGAEILAAAQAIDDGHLLETMLLVVYGINAHYHISEFCGFFSSLSSQQNSIGKSIRDDFTVIKQEFERKQS